MGRFMSRFHRHVRQQARLRFMTFITVAGAGIISYVSTRNLAHRWGFGELSWLYPLCLDAVAAVGMDLWMSKSPAKRPAAWLALFAVGLSLAANVADWMYVGAGAAVLGAVPPLMLAALLLTLHYHAAHTEPVDQTPTHGATTVPVLVNGTGTTESTGLPRQQQAGGTRKRDRSSSPARQQPPLRKGPTPRVSDDVVIAAIQQRQQNGPVSRRWLMAEFNLGTPRATRLMAQARNGTHVDLPNNTDDNP
jgi:hypothetical protein